MPLFYKVGILTVYFYYFAVENQRRRRNPVNSCTHQEKPGKQLILFHFIDINATYQIPTHTSNRCCNLRIQGYQNSAFHDKQNTLLRLFKIALMAIHDLLLEQT